MRTRNLLFLFAAVAIAGIAGWAGIHIMKTTAPPGVETPATRVRRGSVTIAIAARGDIQGGSPEMLMAPTVGQDTLTVTSLRQPGELVEAGDVVAEFDTTQQESNLKEAEADLAEAEQRVIQTQADNAASDEETRDAVASAQQAVDLAAEDVKANVVYAKIKQRDNQIVLEAAQNKLRQAQQDLTNKKTSTAAALAIQTAAQNNAKMRADLARRNIESMTLKAKTTGYINLQTNTFGVRFLTTGMILPPVQMGDTVYGGMAVAQLFDLESWEATAKVSELDRGHLAVGQPVSISVVALGGKSFPGHVKSIGNASGDAWDRKFDCVMTLDQAGPELRPGMSSNLLITAEKLDNVLWAPSQALFERDGRPFVYLKTATGFTPHDVTLVKRSESQAVLTGLNEGDVVALSNPAEQGKPAAKQQQSAMKALAK